MGELSAGEYSGHGFKELFCLLKVAAAMFRLSLDGEEAPAGVLAVLLATPEGRKAAHSYFGGVFCLLFIILLMMKMLGS